RFLFPGVGYGGSCFPKDVKALAQTAREHDYHFDIIETVIQVNERQKQVLGQKIMSYFGGDISGKTFAIWGLAFKPETDDIREAPALELIQELLAAGAFVRAFDPEAMDNVRQVLGDKIYLATDQYDALEGAQSLAIVTEWSAFRTPDFNEMERKMAHHAIFDGRNVYSLEKMEQQRFYYESIGRKIVHEHI